MNGIKFSAAGVAERKEGLFRLLDANVGGDSGMVTDP